MYTNNNNHSNKYEDMPHDRWLVAAIASPTVGQIFSWPHSFTIACYELSQV